MDIGVGTGSVAVAVACNETGSRPGNGDITTAATGIRGSEMGMNEIFEPFLCGLFLGWLFWRLRIARQQKKLARKKKGKTKAKRTVGGVLDMVLP
jgi:hypothetical protein